MTNKSLTLNKKIKMKLSTLLIVLIAFTACQGKSNHNFTINGKIKNYRGEISLITRVITDNNEKTRDTTYKAKVDANGNFTFNIKAVNQELYLLTWGNPFDNNYIILVNDQPNINIEGNAKDKKSFIIKNSKTSNTIQEIENLVKSQLIKLEEYSNKLDSINALPNKSTIVNDYDLKIKALQDNIKNKLLAYYNKADNPFIQVAVLGNMSDVLLKHGEKRFEIMDINKEELLTLINQSIKKYPNNNYFLLFKEETEKHNRNESTSNNINNGQQLPSFSLPNTEGKTVNIDEFKGKYFLLDFWASWCGPCRQESPYLIATYNHFKDKNFTIVSVSLDEDKQAWLKAIQQDKLTWTHLSDLQGWQSSVARMFNINQIPSNFLVNPQGNIIATDLRGEALEEKLQEVLK